jgi:hypothetical protein
MSVARLITKFLFYYGTREIITVLRRTRLWTLSWAGWIYSTSLRTLYLLIILALPFNHSFITSHLLSCLYYAAQKLDTSSTCYILFDFLALIILPNRIYYGAPQYAIFSNTPPPQGHVSYLGSEYSRLHSILEHANLCFPRVTRTNAIPFDSDPSGHASIHSVDNHL